MSFYVAKHSLVDCPSCGAVWTVERGETEVPKYERFRCQHDNGNEMCMQDMCSHCVVKCFGCCVSICEEHRRTVDGDTYCLACAKQLEDEQILLCRKPEEAA